MSLRLFLVESLEFPRSHHAIFVETSRGGGGYIFQVTGNIQQGMRYEMKATDAAPDSDPPYHGQTRLGWISANDIPRIDVICRSNPAPEKQFEGARKITAYPVRRCQEWTAETIGLLRERGVLVDGGDAAS
ncbi:hypothetical protein J3458_001658 [Metarhizium acridum]|uniref:uncharacterized protein n=1 Tax=Metarhizium acridum TaxID=92637 RepID=UPI001C6B88A3|nr:hypothetical protein J3458_001658 [Metarhizium acridum]